MSVGRHVGSWPKSDTPACQKVSQTKWGRLLAGEQVLYGEKCALRESTYSSRAMCKHEETFDYVSFVSAQFVHGAQFEKVHLSEDPPVGDDATRVHSVHGPSANTDTNPETLAFPPT